MVVCSAGYPGAVTTGHAIHGIEDAERCAAAGEQVIVFHAGHLVPVLLLLIGLAGSLLLQARQPLRSSR